jgi:hypothetical protein
MEDPVGISVTDRPLHRIRVPKIDFADLRVGMQIAQPPPVRAGPHNQHQPDTTVQEALGKAGADEAAGTGQ